MSISNLMATVRFGVTGLFWVFVFHFTVNASLCKWRNCLMKYWSVC